MIRHLVLFALLLTSSSLAFADEQYFYTYTTGRDIRFSSITVTGVQAAGLRPGPTKTFASNETVGATAVSPILSEDVVTGFLIFKNFVDTNTKPGISRLLLNQTGELQNEQKSTKLKPTRFDLVQPFRKGGATKLMIGTANDVTGANMDPNGIALGGKFPIFNNPSAFSVGSANFAPDGELAMQLMLVPSNAPSLLGGAAEPLLSRFVIFNVYDAQGNVIATYEFPGIDDIGSLDGEGDEPDDDDLIRSPMQQSLIVLVYRVFRNVGTPNPQSQIQVRLFSASTGQPLGPAKAITNFVSAPLLNAERFPSVAISPNADLILYTVFSAACRQQILKAQQINPETGNKIGGPRVLVGCAQLPPNNLSVGVYGIDIAETGL